MAIAHSGSILLLLLHRPSDQIVFLTMPIYSSGGGLLAVVFVPGFVCNNI